MKEHLSILWKAFVNLATIFSFTVNFILVLVLVLGIGPLRSLLDDLDQAFLGLGETSVSTTVSVNQSIPIRFDLPLNQPLNLNFDLPIGQNTVVVLTEPVPINVPARFTLPGFGGAINGNVSLSLPTGMRLPIQLQMLVPVSRTLGISMLVPVDQSVPIAMDIPVNIPLGEAGLDPAVMRLRNVFRPYGILIDSAMGLVDTE